MSLKALGASALKFAAQHPEAAAQLGQVAFSLSQKRQASISTTSSKSAGFGVHPSQQQRAERQNNFAREWLAKYGPQLKDAGIDFITHSNLLKPSTLQRIPRAMAGDVSAMTLLAIDLKRDQKQFERSLAKEFPDLALGLGSFSSMGMGLFGNSNLTKLTAMMK